MPKAILVRRYMRGKGEDYGTARIDLRSGAEAQR